MWATRTDSKLEDVVDGGKVVSETKPDTYSVGDIPLHTDFKRYDPQPILAVLNNNEAYEMSKNLPGSVTEHDVPNETVRASRILKSDGKGTVRAEISAQLQKIVQERQKGISQEKRTRTPDTSLEKPHEKNSSKIQLHTSSKNSSQGSGSEFRQLPPAILSGQRAPSATNERFMPPSFYATTPLSCPWFFGGFSHQSPVRMKCYQMYHSIEWSAFFGLVSFLYAIYLTLAPEEVLSFLFSATSSSGEKKELEWTDAFEFFCSCCLFLEISVGIIAVGLISDKSCWLRCSNYHRLDMLVLICTLIEYAVVFVGYRSPNLRAIRIFRIFRPITAMEYFLEVRLVILSLTEGLPQLLTVSAIMLLIISCLSVFGIALFKTSYRRHCVVAAQTIPICASDFKDDWNATCDFKNETNATETVASLVDVVAGGYPYVDYCKIYYNTTPDEFVGDYPYDPDPTRGYYHTCQLREFKKGFPVTQTCILFDDYSFNHGFTHFDNVWGSTQAIFQCSTRDGFADIFMVAWAAEPGLIVATYAFFLTLSVILTFLVFGIFSAVVIGTSKKTRQNYSGQGEEGSKQGEEGARKGEEKGSRAGESKSKSGKESEGSSKAIASNEHNSKEGSGEGESKEKLPGDGVEGKEGHHNERSAEILGSAGNEENLVAREMALDGWHPQSEEEKESNITMVLERICNSMLWRGILVAAILANSTALAADQYDAPPTWKSFCRWTYLSVNCVFLVHLGLLLQISGSLVVLMRSNENKLEFVTVMLGFIGLAIGSQNLLLFAAFRVYKLMVYFPTLHNLLKSSLIGSPTLFRVLIFISIVSFVFAVTSRYVIGESMNELTSSNFGELGTAIRTMFQIMYGDAWSGIMFNAVMAQSDLPTKIIAGAFIYIWFMFCAVIIINLLIALIVNHFEVAETMERMREDGHIARFKAMAQFAFATLNAQYRKLSSIRGIGKEDKKIMAWDSDPNAGEFNPGIEDQTREAADLSLRTRMIARNTIRSQIVMECTDPMPPKEEFVEVDERVLFLFSPRSRIRKMCRWLGRQRFFSDMVLAAILGSCFFLTVTPPYDDMPKEDQLLPLPRYISNLCNTVFTFTFLADFLVKVMAQGLLFTSKAYLRESGWNVLDTIVLILGLIDEAGVFHGNIGKLAKLARALRPLRLMMRIKAMRVILNTLIRTMGPVLYVAEFVLFNFVVFGLIGMGLFNGKLFKCNNAELRYPEGKVECSGTFVERDEEKGVGVLYAASWKSPEGNFDTFAESMLLLFRFNLHAVGSADVIESAMAITDIDLSPEEEYSKYNFIFFFTFMVANAFLAMNIFLGFIFDGFNLLRGATEVDKSYNRYMRLLATKAPVAVRFKPPKNNLSSLMRAVISTKDFARLSNTCVLLNFAFMLSDHADASESFTNFLDTQNLVFYFQLLGEVTIMMIAWGPLEYFSDSWRILDFVVVFSSTIAYVTYDATTNKVAKAIRLIRVIRVMKVIKAVRVILETLVACIPSLLNVLILIFLVFSMFACLLSQTFGTLKNGEMVAYYHSINFKTWASALHCCLQIVLMDEWVELMKDASVVPPSCTERFDNVTVYGYEGVNYSWGDCGSEAAPLLFCLLKITCEAVLVNLVVGLILDNFAFLTDEIAEGEEEFEFGEQGPTSNQFNFILATFEKFSGGGPFISASSLTGFMMKIPRPLGFLKEDGGLQIEAKDRWEENFIRAELNVILMDEYKRKQELSKSRWKSFLAGKDMEKKFLHSIHFKDLLHTLLVWRKPSLIPKAVRAARAERDERILEVSESLVIIRFLNHLYAGKMKIALQRQLKSRFAFLNWTKAEPHQKRRIAYKESRSVGLLYPESSVNVELTLLSLLYEDTEYHHESLVDSRLKLNAQTSLDFFRRRSVTDIVVVRFLDPKHSPKGYAIADFTQCNWTGWFVRRWAKDVFYEPGVQSEDSEEQSNELSGWTKIDFIMQVRTMVQDKKVLQYRYQGTLKDVHSFVISHEDQIDEPESVGRYCIRLNVGLYEGQDSSTDIASAKLTKKSYDIVMDVVGYVSSDGPGADNYGDEGHRLRETESALVE